MPAGYQVYDPSGNLLLDTTSRNFRPVGYQTVSSNGTINVPALVGRTPWISVQRLSGGYSPAITVDASGNVTWTYTSATPLATVQIIYGFR